MKQTILPRLTVGALLFGALSFSGCDTRRNDVTGPDRVPPTITLQVVSQRDSVDVGTPIQVIVNARDNLSLKHISVLMNGRSVFDTTFTTATPVFQRTIPIQLAGVMSGTVLQIAGAATDGAGNVTLSPLIGVTAFNSSAPVVSVTLPASGAAFRAGDSTRITVTATDPTGITRIGYQIVKTDSNGAVTILQADSVNVTGSPVSVTRTFNAVILSSLPPGGYNIRGFARNTALNGALASVIPITVSDAIKPGLQFLSPPQDSSVSIGATIRVRLHVSDNVGVARVTVVGISTKGDPDLGAVDTTIRYDTAFAPVNIGGQKQSFPAGTRDTIITRLLTVKNPADSTTGPLYLVARVTDVAGNDSVVVRRIQIVSGPTIAIIRPGPGAVASPGKSIVVELRAVDRDGVRVLGYNVTGAFTATRTAPTPATIKDTLVFIDTLTVPAGTAAPSTFTITPFATDALGQPGSGGSVVVSVQSPAADVTPPLVFQSLSSRVEVNDSVRIRAVDPSGIQYIGFIMRRESDGVVIKRDSVIVGGSFTDVTVAIRLNIPAASVGKKVVITSFAADTRGNIGYSVPSGATQPQPNVTSARPDTSLVVFGRTFSLPSGGVAGDIAVDTLRQRAYLSNITFDRLEVWERGPDAFNAKKIAVGSHPWGMFVDNSADTLLVANSGGTNISRVFIGSPSINNVNEVDARRIKTTNNFVADVQVALDASGIARLKVTIYDYSDRPQYVAQSVTGDIYFSTKPTPSAPDGTLRHYDPNLTQPESQQLWQYGTFNNQGHVAVINADSVFVQGGITPTVSDSIIICDRPYGFTSTASACFIGNSPSSTLSAMNSFFITKYGQASDIALVSNLDIKSLGLEDTTYVAAGGDRRFIAFGEGNSGDRAGRVMTIRDCAVPESGCTPKGRLFSPSLSVTDLVNNASERIYGVAINKNSSEAAAHGSESYFFDVESPFTLRLQGKVQTFSTGSGIAFHPDNIGTGVSLNDSTRVAFVASSNGTIEIVDSFHFLNRGTLPVRAKLYGPIRVTHRFPSDDPAIVLKIFGLTTEGLIVIDVRNSDIKPIAP